MPLKIPEFFVFVVQVMMGGAWYDEYFSNKSEQEIYEIGWNEIKKHLNLEIEPDIHEVSILKVRKFV